MAGGTPRTRWAPSGDVTIAYQVFGQGPLDLVVVPGFVSHLDLSWEHPHRAEAARRWSSFARVVLFDKRNTGLSDRTPAPPTMEERMDDIRAVMDDAGITSAAIVAMSEGGPLALLFAATYPHRVSSLVLISTFARLDPPADLEQRLASLERYWGSGYPMLTFDPGASQDWAARYERASATPKMAAQLLRMNATIDVTAALPAVTAPTLVLHRVDDPVVPVRAARDLAAGLPAATLVELPGEGHMPSTPEEWSEQLDYAERFFTGVVRSSEPDRVLATVLFTDVVASTERAAAVGDREWRTRLEELQSATERLVRQFGGRLVKSTGDGVLATFDGPARAVRCAAALVERAEGLGLPIRAGLHAGEVELAGDDIAGIAVHLAKRVESSASPGTVWVSSTVRDLVVGSGIEFADRGSHDLKGVPGTWTLAEVASV